MTDTTGSNLIEGMRFINYELARRNGMSKERAAAIFPQAEAFERMYIDNVGARQADDCFCPSCGARGYTSECGRCSRPDSGYGMGRW